MLSGRLGSCGSPGDGTQEKSRPCQSMQRAHQLRLRVILFHETQIPRAMSLCGICELNIYFCSAEVSTTAHLFGGKHIKVKYTLK